MGRQLEEENRGPSEEAAEAKTLQTGTGRDKVIIRTSIIGILANVFLAAFKAAVGIVTNSIVNVQALTPSPTCRVILVGGEYNSDRRDFSGPLTERFIAQFHFDKCFLGCDGVNARDGFSSKDVNISSLNACVMERADNIYVLCDSSKLDRCSMVSYAPLHRISALVTNAEPSRELCTALQSAKVHINLCGVTP